MLWTKHFGMAPERGDLVDCVLKLQVFVLS